MFAFDWPLINYLSVGMDGSIASDAIVNIHNRRVTPHVEETAREIANLCRGVLRDAQNGVFLDIGQMTFGVMGKYGTANGRLS